MTTQKMGAKRFGRPQLPGRAAAVSIPKPRHSNVPIPTSGPNVIKLFATVIYDFS
jgi:hypothetical protein